MKVFLTIITFVLLVCFSIQLYLNQNEWASQQTPPGGFAVDFGQDYPVGRYHFLALGILLTLIFAQKYISTVLLVFSYATIHAFATFWRIRTGLFGGDMCPEGGLCYKALRRATWFDWTATGLILIILCLATAATIVQVQARRLSK
ncbi:hypothetical protein BH10ACI2_BH10ACI2_08660 [soil metagenome]